MLREAGRWGATGSERKGADDQASPAAAFVGREQELATLSQMLTDSDLRFVSILGPGGVGKSRLLQELGRCVAGAGAFSARFEQGIRYVDLGRSTCGEAFACALAEAVGYRFHAGEPEVMQLTRHLRPQGLLLLVDSAEQIAGRARLLAALLEGCPRLKIVAASREALGVSAEIQFLLGGLAVPAAGESAKGLEFDAPRLFVEVAARAGFGEASHPHHLTEIVEICDRVQGMPLAIVLAASWSALLTPRDILGEIVKDVDFLQDATASIPARQRSIRAVFESSWKTLQPAERRTFARLSVFRGGFTRAAAEAVADATPEALDSLLRKSLLTRDAQTGRLQMHDLLRQYAGQQLAQQGPEQLATRERHAAYHCELLRQGWSPLRCADQGVTLRELDREKANLHAAWGFVVAQYDFARMEQAIEGLCWYHERRCWRSEGEAAARQVVDACRSTRGRELVGESRLLGLALALRAAFCSEQGRMGEARELLEEALSLPASTRYPRERALALVASANMVGVRGPRESAALAEDAISLFRASADLSGLAWALVVLGRIYMDDHGDFASAEKCFAESVEVQQRQCRCVFIPFSLGGLGFIRSLRGQLASGNELIQRGLAAAERAEDSWGLEICLRFAAQVQRQLGQFAAARALAQRSLALGTDPGSWQGKAWCHFVLGDIASDENRFEDARDHYEQASLLGSRDEFKVSLAEYKLAELKILAGCLEGVEARLSRSLARFEKLGIPWGALQVLDGLGHLAFVERRYEAASTYQQRSIELARQTGALPMLVSACAGLAFSALRQGQARRAAELLARVTGHPATEERTRLRRLQPALEELKQRFSEEQLASWMESGRRLDLTGELPAPA
jgi:predicted ATPase